MLIVNYPDSKPNIKKNDEGESIFCIVRKKWMKLTPEEWVRQNFLLYLTEVLNFPKSLIAVEKQIVLSEVKKRFDIVVYDKNSAPYILVECKEMGVRLSEEVLQQALIYYAEVQSKYVVITNGNNTIAFLKSETCFMETDEIVRPV